MNWSNQRQQDLNDHLSAEVKLLKKYEDEIRVENDIKSKEKIQKDIDGTRKRIDDYRKELKCIDEEISEKNLWKVMNNVGFRELEIVTLGIIDLMDTIPEQDYHITPPREKMKKNQLTPPVQFLLTNGSSKVRMVEDFIGKYISINPNFPERLKAGFVNQYYNFRDKGLQGDKLFHALYEFSFSGHSAPDDIIKAAGLAVLYYFFERCEIFEK